MTGCRFLPVALIVLLAAGCVGRRLPEYERPLPKTDWQRVRTTAYTHTEKDHRRYGNLTAMGTTLRTGEVNSAAADWSRWPAGTVFRLSSTGQIFEVDDYGWALAGRNTIDLYMATREEMLRWGVRPEAIEILRWGDPGYSLARLERMERRPAHVKRMIRDLRKQGG